MIDSRERAEAFRQLVNLNHRLRPLLIWVDLGVLRVHSCLLVISHSENKHQAIPARRCSSSLGKRILTPNTCLIRSATVCTLRGVNSAWRLICSTVPSKSLPRKESTRTRTESPTFIKPSHGSGTYTRTHR